MSDARLIDLDGSLAGLDGVNVDARAWEEAVRFGCGMGVWRRFADFLDAALAPEQALTFFGSGDFHHVSHLLLRQLPATQPVDVVVLDNHPDNMRFPFGIHCGSWVAHAARLPQVRHIHVLGITSADIAAGSAWENHLWPLLRNKVSYWSTGVDVTWSQWLWMGHAVRSFADLDGLLDAFGRHQSAQQTPVYLSIDKDVLAPEVVHTNWDQGRMTLAQLDRLIDALPPRLAGADVTGEVSSYVYRSRWKRWMSARDEQVPVPASQLAAWQAAQNELNRHLMTRLMPRLGSGA